MEPTENQPQPTDQPLTPPPAAEPQKTDTPPADEHMIPKSRFDEVNAKFRDAEKRLAEIEAKEKAAERQKLDDLERAKAELAEVTEARAKAEQERDEALVNMRLSLIRAAVSLEVAKPELKIKPEARGDVWTFLQSDLDKIEVDNGEVKGVEKLIKKIVESRPYLVEEEKPKLGTPSFNKGLDKKKATESADGLGIRLNI